MQLITKRLKLRPTLKGDKAAIFEYRSDSETNRFQGWIPQSPDDIDLFISKLSYEPNQPGSWFQIMIIEKKTGQIIGDLGMHFSDDLKQAEVGCTLNKIYHGKGFATEALSKVVDYLFNELDKHRVFASVHPQNSSSINLLERLGFRKEAHFVESYYNNGIWEDDVIYAILKCEWNATL
ncbi:MAG: GNAT family protein [Prolixibacteraceae bacterium]|jgi:RimJ/RimL family protein N-acetyltransferase|nr:GNAT family protein [Prolixibacteraceae bacterium]